MNKNQAAQFLGVSTRAIERYTTANKLHVTYKARAQGGQEAVYDYQEVVQLKQTREQALLPDTEAKPLARARADTLTKATPAPSVSAQACYTYAALMEGLAQALQQAKAAPSRPIAHLSLAEKLTLSVLEASVLSGLSQGWLREAIHTGQLRAAKRGRGWNIKLQDLQDYVQQL